VHISPRFAPTEEEIDRLVAAYPLATLVSLGDNGLRATPLPLLLMPRRKGAPRILLGHFARRNPQVALLEARPEALAVFNGPHGYISPSWFSDRKQAPTWNYTAIHMLVRVQFDRSPGAANEAVDVLTKHMEAHRPDPWSANELQERHAQLVSKIVAFRAEVLDVQAKFKLGQDERPDVLFEALEGVRRDGSAQLNLLMREANAERLGT
jgi:transcriptional regulator